MEDVQLGPGIIALSEPFKADLRSLAEGLAEISEYDQENMTMAGVIWGLRFWLSTAPLLHTERWACQNALNVRLSLFNRGLLRAEMLRQYVDRLLGDIFDDFIDSGLMAATPLAIDCQTIPDVEAVQILLQHIADVFWNYIPHISVDQSYCLCGCPLRWSIPVPCSAQFLVC